MFMFAMSVAEHTTEAGTQNQPTNKLTTELHGAESLLRSRQSLGCTTTFQRFVEPEGSLPCAPESSIGPYPEADEPIPYHPILFI
jgi:hypothetical protein